MAEKRGLFVQLYSSLLVLGMVVCSLMLWVAVPLGTLWIGSQVQAAADSIGPALLVMAAIATLSIGLIVNILGRINSRYLNLRETSKFAARQVPSIRGVTKSGKIGAIEIIMVSTAVAAIIVFMIWFITFGGSGSVVPEFGA